MASSLASNLVSPTASALVINQVRARRVRYSQKQLHMHITHSQCSFPAVQQSALFIDTWSVASWSTVRKVLGHKPSKKKDRGIRCPPLETGNIFFLIRLILLADE